MNHDTLIDVLSHACSREIYMKHSDTILKIQTLGRFNISINGENVATNWPDGTSKAIFCSLLSPLDLYITWDRICRSTWDLPATRTNRRRMEEILLRPLNSFLIKEIGFTPLIAGNDGIIFNYSGIHLDAFEFHKTVLSALKQISLGNLAGAVESINKANTLYNGCYLPGMSGKIITNTRKDLDLLFRTAVMGCPVKAANKKSFNFKKQVNFKKAVLENNRARL